MLCQAGVCGLAIIMIDQTTNGRGFMKADPNMPVLIVDGYATMVRIMRKLLQQIGYMNVDAAPTVEEAMAKIRMNRYGLIITDWHMQPITGLELLQRIRAEGLATVSTPFLFVTGEAMQDARSAEPYSGVSGYLEKPFSAAILKQKIDNIFNRLNDKVAMPGLPAMNAQGRLTS